jgi:D-Tyr-tRNAtyr deacylase
VYRSDGGQHNALIINHGARLPAQVKLLTSVDKKVALWQRQGLMVIVGIGNADDRQAQRLSSRWCTSRCRDG